MAEKSQYQKALDDLESIRQLTAESIKAMILEGQDALHQSNLQAKLDEMAAEEGAEETVEEDLDIEKLLEQGEEADEDDESDLAPDEEGGEAPAAPEAPATAEVPTEEPAQPGEVDLAATLSQLTVGDLDALIKDAVTTALGGGSSTDPAPVADETPVEGGEADLTPDDAGADFGAETEPTEEPAGEEVEDEDKVDEDLARLLAEIQTGDEIPAEAPAPAATSSEAEQTLAGVQQQLSEALKAVDVLKEGLREQKVWNARLMYCNLIFGKANLKESVKLRIAKQFDQAKTMKEAQAIYNTIVETMDGNVGSQAKVEKLHESFGGASRPAGSSTRSTAAPAEPDFYARMRKLGNIQ